SHVIGLSAGLLVRVDSWQESVSLSAVMNCRLNRYHRLSRFFYPRPCPRFRARTGFLRRKRVGAFDVDGIALLLVKLYEISQERFPATNRPVRVGLLKVL
ncbi:MAG: hypothetical protein J4N66_10795, partial [Chloroflexi bacterium]|nr:hypothetical protein [Chloroflexota bacterium]